MSDNPSKIIVDDDWKSQVEKERQLAGEVLKPDTVPDDANKPSVNERSSSEQPAPPDASFETLLTMLFTQGMAALGQMPSDDGQPLPVNKPIAKHFIDTLEMLSEKTKSNLSEQETTMLGEILHVLRLTFVSVKAK